MQLRRLIREMLLREAAYTPDTLPDGAMVDLEVTRSSSGSRLIIIGIDGRDGQQLGYLRANNSHYSSEPCYDAFQVKMSNSILQGIGPLLYDIAMEVASEIGGGLYADRSEVSGEARNVWDYYDRNRPDVKKFGMDSPENERTPDLYDNCDVEIPKTEMLYGDWWDDPLAKVYVKKGMPFIRRLMELDKIRFKGWQPK